MPRKTLRHTKWLCCYGYVFGDSEDHQTPHPQADPNPLAHRRPHSQRLPNLASAIQETIDRFTAT